jgi:hypothetical protein
VDSEMLLGSGTRSGGRIRRAAVIFGVATCAALLAGCGAGQVTGTALTVPAVPGTNGQAQLFDSGTPVGFVSVRNVYVTYKDSAGYPKGGNASLDVRIFNDTNIDVTVVVSSPAASVELVGGAAATRAPEPTGSASPEPTASPESTGSPTPTAGPSPSRSAGQPARLTIPAGGFAVLNPDQARHLQLTGLTEALPPGGSVPLVFDLGSTTINVEAPVAPPLTPLPRATPEDAGAAEGEHG